jgi:serine/threonine-protein kinase
VEACTRLLSEAELAGCVHHANVVAVQHVDRDARGAFLVLDYVEGGSMKELMRAALPGSIPQAVALRLMLDCLAGLSAIHSASDHRGQPLHILHRDISPENILVGLDGMARLTDFGIARSRHRPALTAPSQLVGKLGFMAPEYIDRGDLGPPLDIYSLGVTLWMLLTGKNPWRGLEEAQLLAQLLTRGVPPLPTDAVISESLRQVVDCACSMDADDRYATAREMAVAIEKSQVPIAEHFEVAAYVGKVFENSTSERRLEAAQLLTIDSHPPPPSSSYEIRSSKSLHELLPIVPIGNLPSLPPLESRVPPSVEFPGDHPSGPLSEEAKSGPDPTQVPTQQYPDAVREDMMFSERSLVAIASDVPAESQDLPTKRMKRSRNGPPRRVGLMVLMSGSFTFAVGLFAWGGFGGLVRTAPGAPAVEEVQSPQGELSGGEEAFRTAASATDDPEAKLYLTTKAPIEAQVGSKNTPPTELGGAGEAVERKPSSTSTPPAHAAEGKAEPEVVVELPASEAKVEVAPPAPPIEAQHAPVRQTRPASEIVSRNPYRN